MTKSGVTINGIVCDAQDRMTSYNGKTYTYTANGELLTKTTTGGITTYNYDVFGNLKKVIQPDGQEISYTVDGKNRRIGKSVNGVFTEGYIYNGQLSIIAKTDSAGTITERYIYGDKANIPSYMVKGTETYRIISDHLGSPRLVVNATTGDLVASYEWDEFGNINKESSNNKEFLLFGFAGGLVDWDTGLTRFGARDYDAETGRWTSKEPLGFTGSDNFYIYCNGNPVNYIDVDGKMAILLVPVVRANA